MVCIDIDIGDALHAVPASQCLDCHAAVIEHTKAGGTVAARVMQARDRHEGTRTLALEYALDGVQHAAFVGQVVVRGRIATVEVAFSGFRLPDHAIDVVVGVKTGEFIPASRNRCTQPHALIHALLTGMLPERTQPIRSERVPGTETVCGQCLTDVHTGRLGHHYSKLH